MVSLGVCSITEIYAFHHNAREVEHSKKRKTSKAEIKISNMPDLDSRHGFLMVCCWEICLWDAPCSWLSLSNTVCDAFCLLDAIISWLALCDTTHCPVDKNTLKVCYPIDITRCPVEKPSG
jgi:hypothetical protein